LRDGCSSGASRNSASPQSGFHRREIVSSHHTSSNCALGPFCKSVGHHFPRGRWQHLSTLSPEIFITCLCSAPLSARKCSYVCQYAPARKPSMNVTHTTQCSAYGKGRSQSIFTRRASGSRVICFQDVTFDIWDGTDIQRLGSEVFKRRTGDLFLLKPKTVNIEKFDWKPCLPPVAQQKKRSPRAVAKHWESWFRLIGYRGDGFTQANT
jgi:hypothetical protein